MTNPWQEWKKKNAERQATGVVRPWDVFNPDTEYADDPTALDRWNILVIGSYYYIYIN